MNPSQRKAAAPATVWLDPGCIICSAPHRHGDVHAVFVPNPADRLLWGDCDVFTYHVCGACEVLHGGCGSKALAEAAEAAIARRLVAALGEAHS
jgi:hypothetical protein